MKNILVYSASEDSKQSILAEKYNEAFELGENPNPKDFINWDSETGVYDFIVVAKYPHTYSRSGIQSVITMRVTNDQEAFIISLSNAITVLAECDNNPGNDYSWNTPVTANKNRFKSVLGNDFFTGSGNIGDEDYIAPRKKLGVLA